MMTTIMALMLATVLPPAADGRADTAPQEEILVEGKRNMASLDAQLGRLTFEREGQMPRFTDPLCPNVMGLEDFANLVADRIRLLGRASGIEVAEPGCAANFNVIISDAPALFMQQMAKERRELIASMAPREFDAMQARPGPAWVWHAVVPQTADGSVLRKTGMIEMQQVSKYFHKAVPKKVGEDAYTVAGNSASRIAMTTVMSTQQVYVIIDARALEGMTLRQLADFSAVAGLAPISISEVAMLGEPSILKLFIQGSDAPSRAAGEATPFDRALLASLYDGQGAINADRMRQRMARQIDSALAREEGRSP